MKIEFTGQQSAQTPTQTNQPPSARDRAIAKLLGTNQESNTQASTQIQETSSPVLDKNEFEQAVDSEKSTQKHTSEEIEASEPKEDTKAPAEEPISSQYAILARKEKAIRQREQSLRTREAAIKAQEETSKPKLEEPKSSFDPTKYVDKERLANDPFSVLTEMGLTYDQLTELAMNGPKPKEIELMNEIKAMREEFKALKGETETTKKSFQDSQEQTYKEAISEIRREANALVKNNLDYETIKETNSVDDVVELIERKYKEDKILMTVEEAAQQIEEYLLEEAIKIAKINKVKNRMNPKEDKTAAPAAKTSNTQPLKTLTNNISSNRPLTPRERAILAFEGKLNK